MEVVLDTVSLNHLLRSPKSHRPAGTGSPVYTTALDHPLRVRALTLLLDSSRALLTQWCDTCGYELVMALITKWDSYSSVRIITDPPRIGHHCLKRLRGLGFDNPIDRLVVRICLASTDRTVVSDDSDFWDPAHPGARGSPQAPVALVLRSELDVTVVILASLLSGLGSLRHNP